MMIHAETEPRVEVHKFYGGGLAVAGVAFLSLVLQGFLPKYFPQAQLFELPLLVTLYFGLARRNPASGLLLGMVIGLLQDAMTVPRVPMGYYGIAKTLVGFIASSIGGSLDTEHPLARAVLAFGAFHVQRVALVAMDRWLMGKSGALFTVDSLIASLLTAALSLALFPLLDRLRKPQ